jgi:hypothetical protein
VVDAALKTAKAEAKADAKVKANAGKDLVIIG